MFFTIAAVNEPVVRSPFVRRVVDAHVALIRHRGGDRHLDEILGAGGAHRRDVTSVATVDAEENDVLSSVWR
jgi:hypothetical protein